MGRSSKDRVEERIGLVYILKDIFLKELKKNEEVNLRVEGTDFLYIFEGQ